MNQNPPPRGPQNPYDPFNDAEKNNDLGLEQTQNQQGHIPTPPDGYGHGPAGHMPGGYPPPGPGPGPGMPMPPGPGPGHYPHPYPGYVNPQDTAVMSTKDWLLVFLIFLIPCVNIIMLFVWAFSGNGNHNRRNYARAYLIFIAIIIGLYLLAIIFFGAIMANMFNIW
ncbi:MAG: hypothetical protein FWC92_01890 [Defluviitaleaceae bacterium]|nr:hypothetical protein [Defluviitaleaceae bacterium]